MKRSVISSFLIHMKVRGGVCIRSPEAWLMFLFFGLTAVVLWPTLPGTPTVDPSKGPPMVVTIFLWLYFWPVLPMIVVRGRATAATREAPHGICGAPALPVGPRTRAVAEATLALGILGLIRWLAAGISQGSWTVGLATETIAGTLFFVPLAIIWALPVKNPNTFFTRPLIITALTGGFILAGVYSSWMGVVLGVLGLSVVALLIAGLEIPELQGRRALRQVENRHRNPLPPLRQLSRDAWLLPAETWGPWVIFALIVYGVCLILDVRGASWEWVLFGGFEVFLVVMLQPLFRPLNSNLLAESLAGKHGVAQGDFLRAWSVLPVERTAVLRRVWVHAMVGGGVLWAVPVTSLIVRHRLLEGVWSFRGGVGDLMQIVVVGAIFVPVLAGVLVAIAAGRKREIILTGSCLLFGVHALFLVRILLEHLFGAGSAAAQGGVLLVLAIVACGGSLSSLRFLRRAPEPA